MKNVEIRPSQLHGTGLFAGEDIKEGEIIQSVEGERKTFFVQSKEDSLAYPNWIGVGPNEWIDVKEPLVFINHSCEPNTGAIGPVGEMSVVALRDISAGEELTIDYSIIEGDPMWEMACQCGTASCRHVIGPVTSLSPEVYRKYLPYVPQYFQGLYEQAHAVPA